MPVGVWPVMDFSLRRLVLACLALSPALVEAAVSPRHAKHMEAMARQVRHQKTGKLARRQEDPDDADDYSCSASKPCEIGCCGPL